MLKSLGRVFDKFNQQSSTGHCKNNVLIFGGELSINTALPEDVILIILSFVTKTDIDVCSQVCLQWKSIVTGVTFWKLKCVREKRVVPPINTTPNWIPKYTFYKNIYFKNPYVRNLIRNPCGAEDMAHWEITESGGNEWIVEKEPIYCDPFNIFTDTNESFSSSCFATSFGECSKHQLINLIKEGCDPAYMDIFQPAIEVSEWHVARGDCGSIYKLSVELLSENATSQIESFNPEVVRVEQWAGGQWSQIKHIFQNYGPGVRYIKFSDGGQDTQFWAGHYGSKMSGASVRFVFLK